ncbi:glycosyltransferase [Cohnella candidum]|uniref:Glycosyltransferase n=1 Tax=Cohnella candidum TaxID=2674991 RepID=A0A3G3JYI9_9BACL|nr:glycosyltransferase [Cohnella candidum]AYQ73326.1 glycosyltransferase [Cohnella candidum]
MGHKSFYGVSIVACTNRPQFFNNILANFKRQLYPKKELIIVINKDSMDLETYRGKAKPYRNVRVYQLPEVRTLGECLNFGVQESRFPYVAKLDDDDFYSPFYLSEQMNAIARTGARIVGKRSYLAFLEAKSLLIMRFPGRSKRYVGHVAGGTILFAKKVFDRVRFPDVSLGEDVLFLRSCRKAGFKIYSTSPYNYVGIRRKNKAIHTWQAHDNYLLAGSRIVAKTNQPKVYRKMATRR